MMPAYRIMDSYPYQRNQIPFPHCYHPGIEAIPPQLKLDPSKSPFPYEQTWPYAGSFGQSIPIHSCCGHNNFPGCCSYRPYPPHASAPSPIYHSGCYPAYGEPFFVPYSPQPQYTMELPRYEYDKYMPRYYHCCGCANHPCNQKEATNVKIEEQESDVGKKVNDALVPIQMKNYPYPFVLIPPEYNKELRNSIKAEATEQDKMSHERKAPGPGYFRADAHDPRVWNGWLPVDINSAPNVVHEGDERRNQNWETEKESDDGKGEHKKPEFPFPIIWMPCYNKQEEEGGRTNNQESASTPKSIEEVPSTFKSVPANSHVDEVVTKETKSNEDKSTNESGSDVAEKVANQRIIPVQQMELYQGKDGSEGSGKKVRNIPVKQREDVVKKDSHISGERHSTSPQKTSKLPPVCLRVDPLPRKKNGGSSRSPSPPASKGHSQSAASETSNTPSGGMNDKAQPNSNCQNAPNISDKVKPKEKTIQVFENKTNGSSQSPSLSASKEHPQVTAGETSETSGMIDKAQPNLQNAPSISEKVMPQEKTIQVTENRTSEHRGVGICADGDKQEIKAEKRAGNMMEEATDLKDVRDSNKPKDEGRKQVKVLSDVDAAVLIQAAYRGYLVRKWEPLKKLKQLAEVSKEVTDVKGRVQAFEDSSNLKSDDKQRIAIGETIMRLLLKLDTIQGLHSILREIRKSLARELISLQERLDSIKTTKPQQQMQELIASKPVENTNVDEQNGEHVEDQQQQQEVAVPREDSSKGISQEECQDQSSMKDCINSLAADDGGSETQSPMDPTSDEETQPIVLPNDMVNEDVSQVVTVDACSSASALSEADETAVHEAKSNVNDIPFMEVDKSDMTTWKELPVGAIDEDTAEKEKVEDMDRSFPATEYDEIIELPVGLLDEDTATPEFEKHIDTEVPIGELGAEDEECIVQLPVGLLDDDTATPDLQKDDRTNISKEEPPAEHGECVLELPVGLLDEDGIVKAESEKHGKTKISEEVQPDEGNAESSFIDDTAKEIQVEQQQLEDQEEVQSSGASDGWVKVEFQKEGELRGDAPMDLEVEAQSGEMIANDTEVSTPISQLNCHEQENGDECLAVNDAKNIQPEPLETMISTQEDVPIQCEEKVAQREIQVECHDLVAKDNDSLAKEETELSAASYASKELPVSNGDPKLLEENEKLRKMMKKLLHAGNEQLNVISNLTGRVKDLEKKLARSKVRGKRFKPAATSKIR